MKLWAEDDRPREKLAIKGRKALSDAELLAILIRSGTKEKSALEISKELLENAGNNLHEFSKRNLNELCKYKGIGPAKATTILAALELGRRRKNTDPATKVKVTSSKVVFEYIKPIFADLIVEEFHLLLLNRASEIIKTVAISQGGITGTVVDGRIIFKNALEAGACYIILCHNHPSGQLKPSIQDIKLTKNLVEFGKLIDLTIIDHLIYTDNGYFSFSDERMV